MKGRRMVSWHILELTAVCSGRERCYCISITSCNFKHRACLNTDKPLLSVLLCRKLELAVLTLSSMITRPVISEGLAIHALPALGLKVLSSSFSLLICFTDAICRSCAHWLIYFIRNVLRGSLCSLFGDWLY